MSLMTSMYSGVSGMEANSNDLSVIGDNIANANTIGFKASRAAFEDAMAQSMMGGGGQMGWGTRLQAIQRLVTQGALANTGLATDLAIQGDGLFVVKGSHNGVDGSYYTRAGQFTVDKDGFLVNLEGLKVQGYGADATGAIGGMLGDMAVGDATSPPNPTANIVVKANLDANATVLPGAFDPLNPATSSNFSTTMTVYDSLGAPHSTDVYFRKTASGAWEWHAMTDGGGLTGGTKGTATEIANGTLTFDTQGRLTAQTQTSNFNPIGSVNPQALNFNFGSPLPAGSGVDGITQFAGLSATSFTSQDGFASGDLARISINAQGIVTGTFTNGQSRSLGQLALADFSAPDQLERLGGNLYGQRLNSGEPNVGKAASGGRGAISAGALEQSNVDLATEFVRMITAQRGFQANSKTITTADQLLQELMNIKR